MFALQKKNSGSLYFERRFLFEELRPYIQGSNLNHQEIDFFIRSTSIKRKVSSLIDIDGKVWKSFDVDGSE